MLLHFLFYSSHLPPERGPCGKCGFCLCVWQKACHGVHKSPSPHLQGSLRPRPFWCGWVQNSLSYQSVIGLSHIYPDLGLVWFGFFSTNLINGYLCTDRLRSLAKQTNLLVSGCLTPSVAQSSGTSGKHFDMVERMPVLGGKHTWHGLQSLGQAEGPAQTQVWRCERMLWAQQTTQASRQFPRARHKGLSLPNESTFFQMCFLEPWYSCK